MHVCSPNVQLEMHSYQTFRGDFLQRRTSFILLRSVLVDPNPRSIRLQLFFNVQLILVCLISLPDVDVQRKGRMFVVL